MRHSTACIVLALGLLAMTPAAHAEPRDLTGPATAVKRWCRHCKVIHTLPRPPRPFLAVQLLKSSSRESPDDFTVYLAVRVKRGWYFRDLGRGGHVATPHGDLSTIDWSLDELAARDVVAGGAPEIVVSVSQSSSGWSTWRSTRLTWVIGVGKRGVAQSEDLGPDQAIPADGLRVTFR